MKSFFQKFREEFRRQTPTFQAAANKLFGAKRLDADSIDDLEEALYGADFGVETTSDIIERIHEGLKTNKHLRGKAALELGAAVLREVLTGAQPEPSQFPGADARPTPDVIVLLGINGAGKTTTAAKLGWRFHEDGKGVILGAGDTFRAAANEQIKSWADRLGLELVASQHGADSAAVAFDSYAAAKSRNRDVLILDTAGRLHTKSNLMDELKKIGRVLQKHDASAPHHKWLVLDGSLGSNSIEQARKFHEQVGLTGLVITKLDGTSRGGALVGIYRELGIPIYYVGLGEQKEDLQPFTVDGYIEAIFGS